MIVIQSECPPAVCLLADHLDTALAIGEDMLALSLAPEADLIEADPETAPEANERFVHRLRQLESSMLTRVLQARRRLDEVAARDSLMRSAAALYRAETTLLADMIANAGQTEASRFDGSNDSYAYLRERGLIPPEAAAPSPFERVAVTEAFRIGGVVELGRLMDVVAGLLDLLDAAFSLYPLDLDEMEPDAVDGAAAIETAGSGLDAGSDVVELRAGEVDTASSEATGPSMPEADEVVAAGVNPSVAAELVVSVETESTSVTFKPVAPKAAPIRQVRPRRLGGQRLMEALSEVGEAH